MRGGLIGEHVRRHPARHEGRNDVCRVRFEADRSGLAAPAVFARAREGVVERIGRLVEILRVETPPDASRIDLDHQRHALVHRHGQRLGAAHAAETGGHRQPATQGATEMAPGQGRQRLIGALQDALRADVNPRSGRHLAVHRQPAVFEVPEMLPGGPGGHEQRVGDEHSRRPRVCAEHTDRFAGLDEQRFVVIERFQRPHDGVERLPAPRSLARPAVDDEVVGPFGHVRVEVVHQHPQRGFLRPALARECRAAGRSDDGDGGTHERSRIRSRDRDAGQIL